MIRASPLALSKIVEAVAFEGFAPETSNAPDNALRLALVEVIVPVADSVPVIAAPVVVTVTTGVLNVEPPAEVDGVISKPLLTLIWQPIRQFVLVPVVTSNVVLTPLPLPSFFRCRIDAGLVVPMPTLPLPRRLITSTVGLGYTKKPSLSPVAPLTSLISILARMS